MRIRILAQSYSFLSDIKLPVEVEADEVMAGACEVHAEELIKVGCHREKVMTNVDDLWWPFDNFDEESFEVVS